MFGVAQDDNAFGSLRRTMLLDVEMRLKRSVPSVSPAMS
jgi:hypothetical protein